MGDNELRALKAIVEAQEILIDTMKKLKHEVDISCARAETFTEKAKVIDAIGSTIFAGMIPAIKASAAIDKAIKDSNG